MIINRYNNFSLKYFTPSRWKFICKDLSGLCVPYQFSVMSLIGNSIDTNEDLFPRMISWCANNPVLIYAVRALFLKIIFLQHTEKKNLILVKCLIDGKYFSQGVGGYLCSLLLERCVNKTLFQELWRSLNVPIYTFYDLVLVLI